MSKKNVAITKSELLNMMSEATELSKQDINKVFEALEMIIEKAVKADRAINIPNLCKIYVHKRKATQAREMKNPFNGELMVVPAKPAHKVVKVKAVKNLKEMALKNK
jgi:DNA-binding protein HU-beta